jgi:hypothetical protein
MRADNLGHKGGVMNKRIEHIPYTVEVFDAGTHWIAIVKGLDIMVESSTQEDAERKAHEAFHMWGVHLVEQQGLEGAIAHLDEVGIPHYSQRGSKDPGRSPDAIVHRIGTFTEA